MTYDFVLFENYHLAVNHYKDIGIIAKLLTSCNKEVAIADIRQEDTFCQQQDIPHLIPQHRYKGKLAINERLNLLGKIINQWRIFLYYMSLLRFCRELRGQTKNVYAGSYFTLMPAWWLWLLPKDINFFFWGLRSARLMEYKLKPLTVSGLNSFLLRKAVNKKKNIKFFVSDEIIKQEFLEIGIATDRLVLRPERVIENCEFADKDHKKNELNILSIGSMRKNKQVELCLDALRSLNDNSINYIIAGMTADSKYEEILLAHSSGVPNLKRLNYRIPEDEYEQLIDWCDFLILCDKKQPSSVTNGTMNEALLKGKPIIAPNYNPYKSYVEKYGIGILYDIGDDKALVDAIKKAKNRGGDDFKDSIIAYQKTLLLDNVVARFRRELNKASA